MVKAWGEAMKVDVTCSNEVDFTEGMVKNLEDGEVTETSEHLWSEMRNVRHGSETETFCFVSSDNGQSWEFGTGLAIFGLVPIQTVSGSCSGFRGLKYANSEDMEYIEKRFHTAAGSEPEVVIHTNTSTAGSPAAKSVYPISSLPLGMPSMMRKTEMMLFASSSV